MASARSCSSSVSSAIKEPVEESLRDVFRCFICMEKLCEAHLCPHCSKLCCYACIYKWLTERRRQCPHCRSPLNVSELVNCRWFEDIAVQVESLQQICANIKTSDPVLGSAREQQDLCRSHQEKMSVYCWTCKVCICHQCALFGGTHDGHTFQKLELVYESHVSRVKEEVSQLQQRLRELSAHVEKVELNVRIVRDTKEERVKEIRNAVDLMIGRLDAQLKVKLMTLMRHKRFLSKETEQLERLVQEIDYQMDSSSHSQLINKSPELLMMIMQAQLKSTKSYISAPIPPDFASELVPQYDSCSFLIERFSQLQMEGLAVYSKSLLVNGLCWRLKVYPCGNGPARGEYLSVFLELSSGPPGSSKYEYRVQMMHETASKEISREFVSEFEIGECWGYNRFFPIDLLATEGYLDAEKDSLELRFQVRPSTYFQRSRDQQWYIHQLLKTHQQQATEIGDLKEQLDRERKQNLLLQKSKAPQVDTQCLVVSQGARRGSQECHSLPPRSDRRSLIKSEANEKIFSEILKSLTPSNASETGPLRPSTAPAGLKAERTSSSSSTSSASSDKNDLSPGTNSQHSMTLLTESSDDDGAVGGEAAGANLKRITDQSYQVDDLNRHMTSLDVLSLASSESETDVNINRRSSVFSFADIEDAEDLPGSAENLIEYSEVLVPATKSSYSAAVEETGVLLNLLEDASASASSMRTPSFKGNRLSYCQPIKSASVLETLLEPPRISGLVSYLTQSSSGSSSSGSNTPRSTRTSLSNRGNQGIGLPLATEDLAEGTGVRLNNSVGSPSSNRSSSDASMSSEVDDVLSSLCKNMLLLNQEQQHSTNGNTSSERYSQSARALFGGSSNNDFDLLTNNGTYNPKQPLSRNSVPQGGGGGCLLLPSTSAVAGGFSDPGPIRNTSGYLSSPTAVQFHRLSSQGSAADVFDAGEGVNWSLFDTQPTTPTSARSDPIASMRRELHEETVVVEHSKSAPNLQST